jgi:uncharacterized protein YaaN involved in tellurite resistance
VWTDKVTKQLLLGHVRIVLAAATRVVRTKNRLLTHKSQHYRAAQKNFLLNF